jgi:hypothetical protein
MEARMPSELAQSRTEVATTGGVVSKILKLLAIIGAAANHFVRPRHPPSTEGPAEGAAQGVEDVGTGSVAIDVTVEPDPEIKPFPDAEINPITNAAIRPIADSVPEQQEMTECYKNVVQ